ncbi:MAG: GntR family transcriptional regulator [Lentisphaeria bacterium]|nr:MAG: GntR family transcriptional regulator [Lentisphaeria bacterium]
MSPEPGIPLREGLKIRHYIFNLVLRHPGESVKVPSSWELAKHFGIARSTVTLAYKALMEEGILIGRPGIGTFLAPRYSQGLSSNGAVYPLIGLLTNLGNNLSYGSHQWGLMAAAGSNLTFGDSCQVRPVPLSGSLETMKKELEQNYLAALVWITPPEDQFLLLQEVSQCLPTVILGRTVKDINSVALDYEEESYQNGKRLLAEGRKKFWAINMSGAEYYIRGSAGLTPRPESNWTSGLFSPRQPTAGRVRGSTPLRAPPGRPPAALQPAERGRRTVAESRNRPQAGVPGSRQHRGGPNPGLCRLVSRSALCGTGPGDSGDRLPPALRRSPCGTSDSQT